jgi:hypothetical protein
MVRVEIDNSYGNVVQQYGFSFSWRH